MKNLITFSFLACFVSCSGKSTQSVNGSNLRNLLTPDKSYPLLPLAGSTFSFESQSVSGTGGFVFQSPLDGIDVSNNFGVQFQLSDPGSLSLVAFSERDLTKGYEITFLRTGTVLQLRLRADGKDRDVTDHITGTVSPDAQLQFYVDVHNNEDPAHILIWTGSDLGSAQEIFSSSHEEDHGDHSHSETLSPGKGRGKFWGVRLENGQISGAAIGPAKDVH